jgi:hypothetical protein
MFFDCFFFKKELPRVSKALREPTKSRPIPSIIDAQFTAAAGGLVPSQSATTIILYHAYDDTMANASMRLSC